MSSMYLPRKGSGESYDTRLTRSLVVIMALVPLIQLGLSYYVSIQILCIGLLTIVLFANTRKTVLPFGAMLGVLVLMSVPLLWLVNSDVFMHAWLGTLREFICFVVLLAALSKSLEPKLDYRPEAAKAVIVCIV